MKLIKEIFKNEEEISLPNAYEVWFNNQKNIVTKEVSSTDKLIYNLLINLDETSFSLAYKNLSNIGLEKLDYINSTLYGFTFNIDDERIKFWIIYLCKDMKEIYFILWYLQYQFKNKQILLSVKIDNIPIFDFDQINKYITYIDIVSKKTVNIFNTNNKGTTLL